MNLASLPHSFLLNFIYLYFFYSQKKCGMIHIFIKMNIFPQKKKLFTFYELRNFSSYSHFREKKNIIKKYIQGENSLVGNFTAISHQWWEMVGNFPPLVGNGGKFPTTGGKWWKILYMIENGWKLLENGEN